MNANLILCLHMQILKEATSAPTSQIPTPISTAPKAPPIPALNYVTLGSFSWDQDDDKVKVRMRVNFFVFKFSTLHCVS